MSSSPSVPKFLLLSGTPPGPQGVGGIILQELCRLYPDGKLAASLLVPPGWKQTLPEDLAHLPVQWGTTQFEHLGQVRFGKAGKLGAWILKQNRFKSHVHTLLEETCEFARNQNIEKILAVLDGPTSISMAAPLAEKLKLPLITLVWDDVRQLVKSTLLDRWTGRRMVEGCEQALRLSERCAIISEPMKRHYEKNYNVSGTILRLGLAPAFLQPPTTHPHEGDVVRIGYAGSMNADDAFQALLRALDTRRWKLAGKNVILRLLGPRFDMRASQPVGMEFLGWRSLEDTIQALAETDVTYLPQPFDRHYVELTTLSFPTKLTTYLAAGRPILLHTPAGSSLEEFHRDCPLGVWCDSLEEKALAGKLEELLTDSNLYSQAAAWGRAALEREFTAEVFRSRVAALLGVEPEALKGDRLPSAVTLAT
ncbi:MAG: glycosyltransferase [Acidobacteriia bacterium]|nr:glycosyltransferase [Terriglobia bacterium]